MFKLITDRLHFSVVTFIAAMIALYLAMSIDLQRPYWAMTTVYLVSQPVTATVRSKALFRLCGTVLGAIVAVVMVLALVNSPVLLSLGMAVWVGFCLAVSLLDRSPRSYLMMLAGYTAVIISVPMVDHPELIFNTAVARTEEICLGIICATVLHSLWFPRPVGYTLRTRIRSWLDDADRWAMDILASEDSMALNADRTRLASAASEIHIMSTHLPFDTSHLRQTTAIVRALHDRILMLIPILASLSDRLDALRGARPELDERSQHAMALVGEWINTGSPDSGAPPLLAKLTAMIDATQPDDWYALNQLGLLTRLKDLVTHLDEGRMLLRHLNNPNATTRLPLDDIVTHAEARPLHSDFGLALRSGVSAAIAILITCGAWVGLHWIEGGSSVTNAAIICCLFASMDDPTPNIKLFGVSLFLAMILAGVTLLFLFPSITTFPMMAMSLAISLVPLGTIMADPAHALLAMVTVLNFGTSLGIQEHLSTDFANFLNVNLSQFFGVLTAVYVTRSFRSMSADASALRLLHLTWKSLANLALGKIEEDPTAFAARMVDRLGLLTPRLAKAKDPDLLGMDVLTDLRIGMDLMALKGIRNQLPYQEQLLIDRLLTAIGGYYAARTAGTRTDGEALLRTLDQALQALSRNLPPNGGRALIALVGLRRNLFPDALYTPPAPQGAA